MPQERPIAFSIAGFDPCAGAGLFADIKTFENNGVYGMGILTANTIQTESTFTKIDWQKKTLIKEQLYLLLKEYKPKAVKIGVVQSIEDILEYVSIVKQYVPNVFIVWDPVLSSTTAFDFKTSIHHKQLIMLAKQIDLITPNYIEIDKLIEFEITPIEKAKYLSDYCAVLLKGGHHPANLAIDYLFQQQHETVFVPQQIVSSTKHGTGCILSSAIASNFAHGDSLIEAIKKSKQYIDKILLSNKTLLSYHV